MSEKKAERTMETVQLEYTQLCNRAGHIQYQLQTFKKDLELINKSLRDLNLEAAAINEKNQAEAKAKQEAEAKAAAEQPKEEVKGNA